MTSMSEELIDNLGKESSVWWHLDITFYCNYISFSINYEMCIVKYNCYSTLGLYFCSPEKITTPNASLVAFNTLLVFFSLALLYVSLIFYLFKGNRVYLEI